MEKEEIRKMNADLIEEAVNNLLIVSVAINEEGDYETKKRLDELTFQIEELLKDRIEVRQCEDLQMESIN